MNQELRRKVLEIFKQLHRTRMTVFEGDQRTLIAARDKINAEFAKHKNEEDTKIIEELVGKGVEVNQVLRTTVIQAEQQDDGLFRAKIRPETNLINSKPYTPMPDHMIGPFKRKKTKCSDS